MVVGVGHNSHSFKYILNNLWQFHWVKKKFSFFFTFFSTVFAGCMKRLHFNIYDFLFDGQWRSHFCCCWVLNCHIKFDLKLFARMREKKVCFKELLMSEIKIWLLFRTSKNIFMFWKKTKKKKTIESREHPVT